MQIVQKIWATIIGTASFIIGTLRFFVDSLGESIPVRDGIIHIVTGLGFLTGAWLFKGKYVQKVNLWLGIFYVAFGVMGINWPHIIAGVISVVLALTVKRVFEPHRNIET